MKTINLLLVESDENEVNLFCGILEQIPGYSFLVEHCRTPAEGIASLSEKKFDVILLDLPLSKRPKLDPFYQVYKQASNIPIIVLTDQSDPTIAEKALKAGAQDYLNKGEIDSNTISRSISYAIERHQIKKHLLEVSFTDGLTGLYNRYGFIKLAQQQLKLAQRELYPLLLFHIDLESLKDINDAFGQQTGDSALIATAGILQETFRNSDIVAREAGDDFLILAINAKLGSIQGVMDRLDARLHQFNDASSDSFKLSFYIGIAEWSPEEPKDLDALLSEAYSSMSSRKNPERPLLDTVLTVYEYLDYAEEISERLREAATSEKPMGQSLLLVEDSPTDVALIQEYLDVAQSRFEVVQVSRLFEALEEIKSRPFDIILLDLSLPDSYGLSTVQRVYEAAPHIPIIILTGNTDSDFSIQALKLGAQDYLHKGYFTETLLDRSIRYAIERNQLRISNIQFAHKLQSSEARFRRIIDKNADGILILDVNQRVLLANQAAETLFQKSSNELEEQQLDLPLMADSTQIIDIPQEDNSTLYAEIRQVEINWQGQNVWLAALRDVTQQEEMKKALKESEERFKSIVENVAIGIYRTTPAGEILFANPALARMLGCNSFEELTDRNLENYGFIDPQERTAFKQRMAQDGQITGIEAIWLKHDGSQIIVRESSKAITDDRGNILYYEGTAEDITAQVMAQKQVRLQAAALDAAANAILITDRHGIITWVNPAFEDLTGYRADEAIGNSVSILNSGAQNQSFYESMWQTILSGRVWQGTLTNRRKNGNLYIEEMTITPLSDQDGEISHFIAIKQDISARKQAEETLQRRLDELTVLHKVAIACVEESDEDQLIEKVTHYIGESIYPDHFGVMLLDDTCQYLQIHNSYRGLPEEFYRPEFSLEDGVVGSVAASGIARRIPDVSQCDEYINTTPGIRSELCVPLKVGERVIGVINVESEQIDAFSDNDERLLTTVAGQLATTIVQIRTHHTERRQRIMAETLSDSAIALNSSLAIDQILDQILDNIIRIVPYETASLLLVDQGKAYVNRHRGYEKYDLTGWVKEISFDLQENPQYRKLVESGQPLIIDDVREDEDWIRFPESSWIRSHLSVPIVKDQRTLGFLNLDHSEPAFFDTTHAEALKTLAHQLATALENARLYKESQQRALELDRLYRASGVLLRESPQNLTEMGNAIVDAIRSEFGKSNCSLLMIQQGQDTLRRIAMTGSYVADLTTAKDLRLDGPGLAPAAIRKKEIINVPDVAEQPDYVPNWKDARSEMVIPLIVSDTVIGVIDVQSSELNAFSQDDERVVSVFAKRAALALENSRLYVRQQHQLKFLESLRQIDLAITGSLNIRVMLEVIIQQVCSQLSVDAVNILLTDSNLLVLKPIANSGLKYKNLFTDRIKVGEGLPGYVAEMNQVVYEADLTSPELTSSRQSQFKKEGFRSYYAIPLVIKGQVKGVMELFTRKTLELTPEWEHYAETVSTQTAIAIDNALMFENLQRSHTEISLAYDTTLEGWAKALEMRDYETVGHSRRVVELTLLVAAQMGLNGESLIHVRRGALLHDIGKMGIPDRILQKPGPLTDEEWEIMRLHPSYAYDWLKNIRYLQPALDIPHYHHEKWDGSGYPFKLSGEQIPLSARIFAIVDVWDALRSDRPYRKAWPHEKTLAYIIEQSGTHFDPQVVKNFVTLVENPQHKDFFGIS